MDFVNTIIIISSVVTSISIIWGFAVKFMKKFQNGLLKDVKSELSNIKSDYDEMRLSLLRIEILSLIANDPTNHDTIYDTFEEYKKCGGNHYIDSVIRRWEREQGLN